MTRRISRHDFSLLKRAKSFTHAGRGLWVFFMSTPNAWAHVLVLAVVVMLGFRFSITKIEWLFVILAAGMVLAAEAFNTAIEIDIDLTSPDYHPHARDTKDVAAGAVLITSITTCIIGVCIFGPYLMRALY
jgi:diacylglycerol kinase